MDITPNPADQSQPATATPQSLVCPACGKAVIRGMMRCGSCGSSLDPAQAGAQWSQPGETPPPPVAPGPVPADGVWPPSPQGGPGWQSAVQAVDPRLYKIAVAQRNLLKALLATFVAYVVFMAAGHILGPIGTIIGAVLYLAASIFSIITVYKLASSFGNLTPIVYVICAFIPCAALLSMLYLNGKATTELQKAGIKVGLLGADPAGIAH